MRVICPNCGNISKYSIDHWRCPCGSAWEVAELPSFDPEAVIRTDYSIWRYGRLLGLDIQVPSKAMGVGWTPLVPFPLFGKKSFLKLEYLMPSGSFKDRGVNAMVNQLISMGVNEVVEDSSGNAGASLAAHAARFGIRAKIFVPASTSASKKNQIEVYGAAVQPVPGPRSATERAVQASISPGCAYASHAYNPAYLAGQASAAYEIWEQMGGEAPDWLIIPVAQGGLFLGCWIGFHQLLQARLINRLPKLVAVQSALIAPLYQAWVTGSETVAAVEAKQATVAEGAAISKPVRGRRLLEALRETEGRVLVIEEQEIKDAQTMLAQQGYFVEPTSALALAGFSQLREEVDENETVVIPLTGTGLKTQKCNQ